MTVDELIEELNAIPKKLRSQKVSVCVGDVGETFTWMDCSDAMLLFFDENTFSTSTHEEKIDKHYIIC